MTSIITRHLSDHHAVQGEAEYVERHAPEIGRDAPAMVSRTLDDASEYLAREYEFFGYPTYADLARRKAGEFTLCSIRAIEKAQADALKAALTPAQQPEGQIMDGWVDDKTFIEPVSPASQEPEVVRHSFDGDGWSYADRGNGSDWLERALNYPDAEPLYAHPPQPSETVAEAINAVLKWENKLVRSDDDLKERNAAFAALRAMKGADQ